VRRSERTRAAGDLSDDAVALATRSALIGRFAPEHFEPATVRFSDPKRGWNIAFQEGE
jgi:hypothetical protein